MFSCITSFCKTPLAFITPDRSTVSGFCVATVIDVIGVVEGDSNAVGCVVVGATIVAAVVVGVNGEVDECVTSVVAVVVVAIAVVEVVVVVVVTGD